MARGLAERYAAAITEHSRVVIALLLVLTLVVAAGAAVGESEDAGIGEFETDSEETAALEEIEATYGTDDAVVAQLVVRDEGGDVLTRDSLLEGLYLQRDVHENETLNATLDEEGFVALENVVATGAVFEDRAAELEDRGAELGERAEELNETATRLETALDAVVELQTEYTTASLEYEAGAIDESTYDERTADLDAQYDDVLEEASDELTDEQRTAFESTAETLRAVQDELVRLEADDDAPDQQRLEELSEQRGELYERGTAGVLAAEFERLEDDREELEAEGEALEEAGMPPLEAQLDALESRSDEEVESLLADVLDPGADQGGEDAYEFLPTDYEPGSTEAESRIAFLFQVDDSGPEDEPQAAYDAQVAIDALVEERFDDAFVFGQGVTDAASASAVGDSFAIITPVALVLVLFVLGVTYRDLVDVLLGVVGISLVMAWLAGILGWLEIPSSQLLIAVPFLLIGLSIDYSLHVVMRYREARAGTLEERPDATATEADAGDGATDGGLPGPRGGMGLGLAGVVLALAAATFSTGVGFLSNVVSPLPAIQDFAILSAGGILATFVVFGALVPALKVEVDELLERRFDRDRAKEPFGMGAGVVNRALLGVVGLVRRAPLAVVVLALLLAVGGAYGATGIDTEFNQADFLPQDAPEWAKSLPGPFAPDTYTIADDAAYLGDNFLERGEGSQAQVLIGGTDSGDVTDPATLTAIDDASDGVEGETIAVRPGGQPAIEGPPSVIRELTSEHEAVAAALEARDTTGDGLPNEDVAGFYDVLFEADADRAGDVLYRTDGGQYESARLLVDVRGDAAAQDVADDTRDLAAAIEASAPTTAIAAGGPVTTAVVQDALLETLVQAFAVTLVVILAFLTILYWVRHRSLTLGAVTLVPVVAALAWLLGTMAVFDVPFNSETAVITSLAIGLGVDYAIHVSERFVAEREKRGSSGPPESRTGNDVTRERSETLDEALVATVTGTGGALLGSAATTAAGFGVLALALAPPLQRFGLVTGLSIVFAFVACVTVLPCLLVVRERLLTSS
ncbi:efflux RND transporter permease subunit [Natronobeatus ordinarius]|uniref:efflux RND transporter permease subunit n=1 Tax=Natronobeatus ordinarius TaxID=2963433 RepID=UPI0020CE4C68|nr:MMPL family transporter [Natronobeatus ordinarius]